MTKAYIYNMAMGRLLEKIEKETERKERLKAEGKVAPIAEARLERYYAEEKELHEMILEAEREAV